MHGWEAGWTLMSNIKCKWPLLTALVILSGKEYVGIVRLHNAIESEAQLARVSLTCS